MSSIEGGKPNLPDITPSTPESQGTGVGPTQTGKGMSPTNINESFKDGISSVLGQDSDVHGQVLDRMASPHTTASAPPEGAKGAKNPFFGALPIASFFNILTEIAKEHSVEAFAEAERGADAMENAAKEAVAIGKLIKDIARQEAKRLKSEAYKAFVSGGCNIAGGYFGGASEGGGMAFQGAGQVAGGFFTLEQAGIELRKGNLQQVKTLTENVKSQFERQMQTADESQRKLHSSFDSTMQLLNQLIHASTQANLFNKRG